MLQSDAYKYYEERMNEIYAEGALQHEVQFRLALYLYDDDKNKGARDGLNLWGEGSNGKSVSPKLLQEGFGSHIVQSLTMSHIQPNPREDPNASKTWPLDKDGARVLYSSEGKKKNDTLNNSTVLEYNSVLAKAVHGVPCGFYKRVEYMSDPARGLLSTLAFSGSRSHTSPPWCEWLPVRLWGGSNH